MFKRLPLLVLLIAVGCKDNSVPPPAPNPPKEDVAPVTTVKPDDPEITRLLKEVATELVTFEAIVEEKRYRKLEGMAERGPLKAN